MKRLARLALVASVAFLVACASASKTEFKSVSVAVAGVEAARKGYYDIRQQCLANPSTTTLCPQIVASHDTLAAAYAKYQLAVKTLADANIAAINAGAEPTASAVVADALNGLITVAQDFVLLESATVGGKK